MRYRTPQNSPVHFDPDELLIKIVILLLVFPIHEAAHATMALWLGDDTAKHLGRVSLNPLKHLDLVGTIMMLIPNSIIGWAKPVPYNPLRLRGSRSLGGALISVAGPLSNFLVALLVCLFVRFAGPDRISGQVAELLVKFSFINLALFIFNLIPLPPLDGFGVVSQLAAGPMKESLHRLNAQYGFLILFAILVIDDLSGFHLISQFIHALAQRLLLLLIGA